MDKVVDNRDLANELIDKLNQHQPNVLIPRMYDGPGWNVERITPSWIEVTRYNGEKMLLPVSNIFSVIDAGTNAVIWTKEPVEGLSVQQSWDEVKQRLSPSMIVHYPEGSTLVKDDE